MENTWKYLPEVPNNMRYVLVAFAGEKHPINGYYFRNTGGNPVWCDAVLERAFNNQDAIYAWMELPETPPIPEEGNTVAPTFIVYGKTSEKGDITIEHRATNEQEAVKYAENLRPDCTFTLAVPKT